MVCPGHYECLRTVSVFAQMQEDRSSSVTIGIPDEHIGIVVGRGGRNIMELSQVCKRSQISFWLVLCTYAPFLLQLSGARIKISERGDFMSGTSDRYANIAF